MRRCRKRRINRCVERGREVDCRCVLCWHGIGEQIGDVRLGLVVEARNERIEIGVRGDFGGVDVELLAPNQPRRLAQIDDPLKEALEAVDTSALPNPGQARVIRQILVEGVAQVPPVGQVERSGFDELALGTQPFEEHDELQLDEDDWIDTRPAALSVQLPRPLTDEAQIECRLQMPVEVVGGDQFLQ